MSKDSHTQTDQRQFWQMAIDTWQVSGLSVRQFCKQEGLSESSFYAWRKQLTHAVAPALGIDNNVAERMLRRVVIGRKNYLFAGSEAGAKRAAILYSLVASCKWHGHDLIAVGLLEPRQNHARIQPAAVRQHYLFRFLSHILIQLLCFDTAGLPPALDSSNNR